MLGVDTKVFCKFCGNLLNFVYDKDHKITCNDCLNSSAVAKEETIKSQPMNTSKYDSSQRWKNKLYNQIDRLKVYQEGGNITIVVQDCPNKKCDSKEMKQYAMQTRSADEGSTIFSECPKCGHKSVVNN